MRKILIFAGTTEGRELAEFAGGLKVQVLVSVATEYGKTCLDGCDNIQSFVGRMNEEQIESFIKKEKVELVIDATHPFAVLVTRNIRSACENTGTEYLRCLRRECEEVFPEDAGEVVWTYAVEQAVKYLEKTEGNILIATGSKELEKYASIPGYKERCYARVLSTEKAVEHSIRLGFEGKHLIAMQGPFSEEMNLAMLRHVDARYFVTKESGKAGGFPEKVKAAKVAGAVLIVVGRPEEEGLTLEEVCDEIQRRYGNKNRG